jgi:serine/threonine protein kinase
MPTPPDNPDAFLALLLKSGLVDEPRLKSVVDRFRNEEGLPQDPAALATALIGEGLLTDFQAEQIQLGKWRRFNIKHYQVLDRLRDTFLGSHYLCVHHLLGRQGVVTVKVLPTALAEDEAVLDRFYREARALAGVDHPNIIRAYDIDQDDKFHFLVTEFVDGSTLDHVVTTSGPLAPPRAAHLIRQVALGLQHVHGARLVLRNVTPSGLLVGRSGTIKVGNLEFVAFRDDSAEVRNITRFATVLETIDYLAPEHHADERTDIYGLGCTLYFCLTGRPPFEESTVAQKLIWHQTRHPRPVREIRPEIPEALAAVVEKMMAKDPADRYPSAAAVAEALDRWRDSPGPLPDSVMPRWCPAVRRLLG